jgi:hypothetical protein
MGFSLVGLDPEAKELARRAVKALEQLAKAAEEHNARERLRTGVE